MSSIPTSIALEVFPGAFAYYQIVTHRPAEASLVIPYQGDRVSHQQRLLDSLVKKKRLEEEQQLSQIKSILGRRIQAGAPIPRPVMQTASPQLVHPVRRVAEEAKQEAVFSPIGKAMQEAATAQPKSLQFGAIPPEISSTVPLRQPTDEGQSCNLLARMQEEPSSEAPTPSKRQKVEDSDSSTASLFSAGKAEAEHVEAVGGPSGEQSSSAQVRSTAQNITSSKSDDHLIQKLLRDEDSEQQDEAPQKVYLDKFKKHLIRLFRSHINEQFNTMFHKRHYRWVTASKRRAIRQFFTTLYAVPEDVFDAFEGVFARLILNTAKDLSIFGIEVDPVMDSAMGQIFRKKPNVKNTRTFFSCEVIQKIWNNCWEGPAVAFKGTKEQLNAVVESDPREVSGLKKQFKKIGVNYRVFFE